MREMTNIERNSRTLIICFTIAFLALIPLRFVEWGNMMAVRQNQVLGESQVKLPSAEKVTSVTQAGLEATYNEIDQDYGNGCYDRQRAMGEMNIYLTELEKANLDDQEMMSQALEKMEEIEANLCE